MATILFILLAALGLTAWRLVLSHRNARRMADFIARSEPFDPDGKPPSLPGPMGEVSLAFRTFLRRIELEQQYRAEQLSAACHEVRSPITSLAATAELARIDKTQISAASVLRTTDRLNGLVDDVVSLALAQKPRALARQWHHCNQEVDLLAVSRAQVRIRLHPAISSPTSAAKSAVVTGNEQRLGWAVSNLLSNATQHCQQQVEIHLDDALTSDGRSALSIRIADDGAGLLDETDSDLSSANSGGLGLTIVQSVVQSHDGELLIEPRSELGGAAFTMFIPVGTPVASTPVSGELEPTDSPISLPSSAANA